MRRFGLILIIALAGVALVAIVGPELPENNIINGFGSGIRDVVGGIGDSIGFSSRGLAP